MPRKTIGKTHKEEEEVDFGPLVSWHGVTLLKFGRRGPAREKVFNLSQDKRLLRWQSQYFCSKLGRWNEGRLIWSLILRYQNLFNFPSFLMK